MKYLNIKHLKKKGFLILFTSLIFLGSTMYLTKPADYEYDEWALELISEREAEENPLKEVGLQLLGEKIIADNTFVEDYFFLKVYTTSLNDKELKVIGLYNNFIPISIK
ncbi:DUF4359 domain-containing protein [Bacillus carboniphilus]|uniref:DUF4359 domain-containing protein n=1 Tax=Bacillus carboniphilus TaxID=86663 RepID=A0ABY9JWG9_9BACI|nr:DUF4359 domain-containing protein [Bacillus carboniphilus]WLR42853.1 DUF4359 domain-containing protein [Bacillus carboniphilus]